VAGHLMKSVAEQCAVTALLHGECDKYEWGVLLWTCALIDTNTMEGQHVLQHD